MMLWVLLHGLFSVVREKMGCVCIMIRRGYMEAYVVIIMMQHSAFFDRHMLSCTLSPPIFVPL